MPAPVIDYRNPATPNGRKYVSALTHLQRRAGATRGIALAQIIGGAPLLFVASIVLGSVFWFATLNLVGYYPWSWFFGAAVLIVIPSLCIGEARQRGGWREQSNLDSGPTDLAPTTAPFYFGEIGALVQIASNPRAAASGFVEIFLVGPRLVLDGFAKLSRTKQLNDVSLERAAEVVTQLSNFDSGQPVQNLLRDGEVQADLVRVLCLLAFHDWVGVSKTGDRVWLLSEARKRLGT